MTTCSFLRRRQPWGKQIWWDSFWRGGGWKQRVGSLRLGGVGFMRLIWWIYSFICFHDIKRMDIKRMDIKRIVESGSGNGSRTERKWIFPNILLSRFKIRTFVIQSRGGGMEGIARILLNTLIWQEENLPAKSHGVSKECHMGWSFITPKHACCKVKTGLYFVEVSMVSCSRTSNRKMEKAIMMTAFHLRYWPSSPNNFHKPM